MMEHSPPYECLDWPAWNATILRLYSTWGEPQAVYVTGLPGSGKSPVMEHLCRYFSSRGGCVFVDGMELAYLHPQFDRVFESEVEEAWRAVEPDAYRVADELVAFAIAGRRHLLVESRLRTPGRELAELRTLRNAGYHTTLILLATPVEECRARRADRATRQEQEMGITRPRADEEEAAALVAVPAALTIIEIENLADEIHVISPGGQRVNSRFAGEDSTDVLPVATWLTDPSSNSVSVPTALAGEPDLHHGAPAQPPRLTTDARKRPVPEAGVPPGGENSESGSPTPSEFPSVPAEVIQRRKTLIAKIRSTTEGG